MLSWRSRNVRRDATARRCRECDAAAAPRSSSALVDPGPPARLPLARDLLVDPNGDRAVEPAARRAHRRMAADAPFQLARRRGRARVLHMEDAGEGRPPAQDAADRRPPCQAEGAREGEGSLASTHPAGFRQSIARRGSLEAERAAGRRAPACACDDLPDQARLPANRRVSRVVRPCADGARLLPRPLQPPSATSRPHGGSVGPALASARVLQQRLHLQRRPERRCARRARERATQVRTCDPRRLPERGREHRGLARRRYAGPRIAFARQACR